MLSIWMQLVLRRFVECCNQSHIQSSQCGPCGRTHSGLANTHGAINVSTWKKMKVSKLTTEEQQAVHPRKVTTEQPKFSLFKE